MVVGEIHNKPYYIYALKVVNGDIPACHNIKLACQRFINDLERNDLEFRVEDTDKAIQFISIFRHNTGKFAGKKFTLLDWQSWIVASLFGFYHKKDGTRKYRTAYIQVARKNGKTQLLAAIALYALIGEKGAQVILAANSREQASIALKSAIGLVKSIDAKGKYLPFYRSEIKYPTADAFLKIVSADTSKLDGLNCSLALIDEAECAKTNDMYNVLSSSMGMRENPLICMIGTAGFDKDCLAYRFRGLGIEVLNNIKTDDTFFTAIYELDETDDWTDEKTWIKASPSLGETVTYKFMREQINSAILNTSVEVGVRTKLLNEWLDSEETWIADRYVIDATHKLDWEAFRGEECNMGVDLAAVSDLTAVSYMFARDDKYYFFVDYYLPSETLKTSSNRELYKLWKRLGYLNICEGNVTDYDRILHDIKEKISKYGLRVNSIAYDSWNSTQWAIDATAEGLPLVPYSQTIGSFNRPTKEFERLMLQGRIKLDNNEITRFCLKNCHLKVDHNGNSKPDKSSNEKKIDGVIASLQALGQYLLSPHYSYSI